MDEQQLQQAFIQFLAQKHGIQSQQELEALVQQLGEEGLQQEYAEFMQMIQQQQAQMAKHGAKLNYIKQLRGQCPDGYEMQYFKAGGRVCKKCMKKAESVKPAPKMQQGDAIEEFKCGRKMKKKEQGGNVEMDKCGSKMKKKACGGDLKKKFAGGGKQKATNSKNNKVTLVSEKKKTDPYYNSETTRTWSDGTTSKEYVTEDGVGYRGRNGEYGFEDAVADSLYRADWSGKTAPVLPKRRK